MTGRGVVASAPAGTQGADVMASSSMTTAIECVPCLARQAAEAVTQVVEDPAAAEELLRTLLREIAEADWQGSPPVVAQRIHRVIRRELDCRDPYAEIKSDMNRAAERLVPALREEMAGRPDPREAAVRLAIGGNLLDSGARTRVTPEDLAHHVDSIWTQPLHGSVEDLFRAADDARSILYLADNAGEIYFDRLLVEQLPVEKITLVVRGSPVLNDATVEDAVAAGLTELVPVIGNGSDAPGTILDDCSEEFRRRFETADLVIAKGQGNYESLAGTDRPVFFLFTVKCPVVARQVGAPVGTLVVGRAGKATP